MIAIKRMVKKFSCIFHPDSPNVNIRSPLLYPAPPPLSSLPYFLYIVHIYICIYILVFCLNHLRVSCRHYPFTPKYFRSVSEKERFFFLCNCRTSTKIRELIQLTPYIMDKVNTSIYFIDFISDFTNYSNNVLCSKRKSHILCYSQFSCIFSLDVFEQYSLVILWVWVCLMFFRDYIRHLHFWQQYYWSNSVFISLHTVLICPITGDVSFDHLDEKVSAQGTFYRF